MELNKNINKRCGKCHNIKLHKEFKLRNTKLNIQHSNLDSYCIICRKLYDKVRHRANKDKKIKLKYDKV